MDVQSALTTVPGLRGPGWPIAGHSQASKSSALVQNLYSTALVSNKIPSKDQEDRLATQKIKHLGINV